MSDNEIREGFGEDTDAEVALARMRRAASGLVRNAADVSTAVAARLVRAVVPGASSFDVGFDRRWTAAVLLVVHEGTALVWDRSREGRDRMPLEEVDRALTATCAFGPPDLDAMGWLPVVPVRRRWRVAVTDEVCAWAADLHISYSLPVEQVGPGLMLANGHTVAAVPERFAPGVKALRVTPPATRWATRLAAGLEATRACYAEGERVRLVVPPADEVGFGV